MTQCSIPAPEHCFAASLPSQRKGEAPRPIGSEPVVWRVLVNDNGRRMFVYTERLPYEPLTDSGIKVLADPEALGVIGSETCLDGRAEHAELILEWEKIRDEKRGSNFHYSKWLRALAVESIAALKSGSDQ